MINYLAKHNNKLNTHKSVRENIRLNNNRKTETGMIKNLISDDLLISQFSEINLINHINSQRVNKKEKLIGKWWEN